MVRSRVMRYVSAIIAAMALIFAIPTAMQYTAYAAEERTPTTDRISADDLAATVPFTVKANEDISNRNLVAIRLANYALARTDGTNITGLDVTDAGYATKIAAAITAKGIDTSKSTTDIKYDVDNPMPWVMENLLQASQKPWEDDDVAKPNLRAFMTALRNQFGDSAKTADNKTIYEITTVSDNGQTVNAKKSADVTPGVYMVIDYTDGNASNTDSSDRASIPMINGTGVQYTKLGEAAKVLTTLKKNDTTSYTLGEVDYKVAEVTTKKTVTGPQTGATAGDQAHAQIGQTVTFTLTTTVPLYTGFDEAQLKLRDTLGAGLTFGEITSVTVTSQATKETPKPDPKPLAKEYYIKVDPTDVTDNGTGSNDKNYTFDIVFAPDSKNDSNLVASKETKEAFPFGATITVTYTATLDKDAVIQSTGNPNTVTTLYSHNPNNTEDLEKTPYKTVRVYTGQISLKKTDMSGKTLQGAEFNVLGSDGNALKVVADSVNGVYRIADATEQNTATTTLTTPDSGILVIKGLDGTYTVKETKSPLGDGVLLPSFKTTVETSEKEVTSETAESGGEEAAAPTVKQVTTVATANSDADDINKLVDDGTLTAATTDVTAGTVTYIVKNPRNLLDMPKTGATWLAIYAVMAVLFAGAGFALVWRARKN